MCMVENPLKSGPMWSSFQLTINHSFKAGESDSLTILSSALFVAWGMNDEEHISLFIAGYR